MMSRFYVLFFAQLAMTSFLFTYVTDKSEGDHYFDVPPPSLAVVLSRWICALFLHISQ